MLALGLLQFTANVSRPKQKKKKCRKPVETREKKKNPFIFLSMPFILFAILKKKKNQILNFKIRKSKIQKKKKKKKRENWH
jgi:hypothetical protein